MIDNSKQIIVKNIHSFGNVSEKLLLKAKCYLGEKMKKKSWFHLIQQTLLKLIGFTIPEININMYKLISHSKIGSRQNRAEFTEN